MKKYLYISLVSLINLLFVTTSLQLAAQNKELNFLQNSLENYTQNNLQEKLFIHTDKNIYISNEICWFKIYNVDAILNKPINISKVAYLELLENNNKAVIQEKIALNEGTGNGSVLIPTAIPTGNYTLRAYTNWMKNFSSSLFFEKKISIINPSFSQEENYLPTKENYSIQIFPEGGNLIADVPSKVAFKVVNQWDKGIQAKGYLINEKGDTITNCETINLGIGGLGMGIFNFTPQDNHSYTLWLKTADNKIITQSLGVQLEKGYALSIQNPIPNDINLADTGALNIKIIAKKLDNRIVYLIVHARGLVTSSLYTIIDKETANFQLDKNKLSDGINILTLFDETKQPICERLYFKYPSNNIETSIRLESPVLDKRNKVNLQIDTKQAKHSFTDANLSMAVFKIDSIQNIESSNIQNYIWLSADLTGSIENPASYFKNINSNTLVAMDNLMLVNGWRRYKWENVLSNTKPSFTYLPELTGSIITGKVIQKGTTTPVKDIAGFISMPSINTLFKAGISDENGNIKFEFPHLYNDGQVIVQADSNKNNFHKIEIDNPFLSSKKIDKIVSRFF